VALLFLLRSSAPNKKNLFGGLDPAPITPVEGVRGLKSIGQKSLEVPDQSLLELTTDFISFRAFKYGTPL